MNTRGNTELELITEVACLVFDYLVVSLFSESATSVYSELVSATYGLCFQSCSRGSCCGSRTSNVLTHPFRFRGRLLEPLNSTDGQLRDRSVGTRMHHARAVSCYYIYCAFAVPRMRLRLTYIKSVCTLNRDVTCTIFIKAGRRGRRCPRKVCGQMHAGIG